MIFSQKLESFTLYTEHDVYKKDYKVENHKVFELLKNESAGSIKYIILACYLTLVIKEGLLIWIDELDAQLHVDVLDHLIKLYNHAKINTLGSQMIFITHSTSLLSDKSICRDQIVIIHKN